ncbi:MAG: recombinase family protein [Lachnospiraceae bacterium]|nr:recombinase family protein [Lachnospiraceae bacterium]
MPVTAIYARQSIDKKDSISIETQIETCTREAEGEEPVIYSDKGFSGKNTNRPDFGRLMEDIKEERIRRVIVYKLDRISRSVLDFAKMMEIFTKHHVEFVSCTERFDTSTAMGRAMLNIAVVFAQLERETIQMRVTDAYYSRSHKGYYMGGRVPYGFKLEDTVIDGIHTSRFVPEPEAMKQVKMIYQMYSDPAVTLGDVRRALTDPDVLAAEHKAAWSTARISEMIRNPVYVKADADVYRFFAENGANIINPVSDYTGVNGLFLYRGMDAGQDTRKQYDLKGRDVVLAPHEGVIDAEVWLACRRKLMKNRRLAAVRRGTRSWLTGKVKCKKCGYAYQVTASKATKAGRYFQCSGARYSVRCKGAGHTIYADEFEAYMADQVKAELAKLEYLSEGPKQKEPETNEYKIRIAELDREIEGLLDKVAAADDTLMGYINRRIAAMDAGKQELQKKIAEKTEDHSHSAGEREQITDYLDKWSGLEILDKQRVADILIDRIEIGEKEIEVFWNI